MEYSTCSRGVFNLSTINIWGWIILYCGGLFCAFVGCLAASLTSVCHVPMALTHLRRSKISSHICTYYGWGEVWGCLEKAFSGLQDIGKRCYLLLLQVVGSAWASRSLLSYCDHSRKNLGGFLTEAGFASVWRSFVSAFALDCFPGLNPLSSLDQFLCHSKLGATFSSLHS